MWKGLLLMTILVLFLFAGMKLLLDSQTQLVLYDKTAINLMVVSGILDLFLMVNIMFIAVAECVKDKTLSRIFSEFYMASCFFLCTISVLCIVYYLVYVQAMKPHVGKLLVTVLSISTWVLVLATIILCIYCCRGEKSKKTDMFTKRGSGSPLGRKSQEKELENLIRSLPTIIYQKYHDLKTEQCNICDEKFAHGESLKVYPKCYHIFHHECIKEWYKSRQSCPIDSLMIDERDIDRMDSIEDRITKEKCIN